MNHFWPRYATLEAKDLHGVCLKKGEQCHKSKLNERAVKEIRQLYYNFGMKRHRALSQRSLAARYGVDQMTIGRIVRRVTWRHVQ